MLLPTHLLKLKHQPLHGLPLVYLLRYLRLTPLLLFMIFAARVTRYVGDGPLFYHYQRSPEWLRCDQHWWATVLYVNNFVPNDFLQVGARLLIAPSSLPSHIPPPTQGVP